MQPVIKWGRAWLEDNSFDRRARDVALTAALAHCDLAGQPPASSAPSLSSLLGTNRQNLQQSPKPLSTARFLRGKNIVLCSATL